MLGVILAVLCAIFIGLSQLFLRRSYSELKPSVAFFFDSIFGLVIWVPLALIMGISAGVDWQQAILFAVISAILSEVIVFFALSHGELAVTATILATYPVYTVIFSRLLNNEALSTVLLLFVALAIIGSVLASTPSKIAKRDLRFHKATAWPFVAAICIGLSDTLSKGYINVSADFSFLFALGFVQIPIAVAYLRIERQSIVKSLQGTLVNASSYKFALLGGLFNIIGTGFLWLSFSFAPASVASPITGSSGALTVLFARLALRDKVSIKKYVGIGIAFIGVLGIAILRS